MEHNDKSMIGTTIIMIRKNNQVVIAGDGQVSLGQTIIKNNAKKVRRLGPSQDVIAGFAGATADALTLFDRLEAMMLVGDKDCSFVLTGNGDVLEPEEGVVAIGSGGNYALAAAKALFKSELDAKQIAEKSMKIASEICVYTNNNLVVETIEIK